MKSFSEIRFDIVEVLTKDDPAGKWISDFMKSDAPQFAGKSEKKKKQMALAAYYAKQNESKEAEVEEPEEEEKKEESVLKKAKKKEVEEKDCSCDEELKGDQHKLDKNKNGKLDKQGVAEAEKKPHPETWHDVDPKLGKQVDKMSQAEKVKKGFAHPDTLKKKKEQGVKEEADNLAEVNKDTLNRYVTKAVDSHGHADFSARMSKDDPSLRSYHKDQKRTAEKRQQGISRALDRMSKKSVGEGWDEMMKAVKEKSKPQPNGGSGKKQGSSYGGSKQKDEPVKEAVQTPEQELERLKLRQNAEHGKAPLKRQAETQARIRELQKQVKEEAENIDEAMTPQQKNDFDRMMAGAMSRAAYNAKWKKPLKSDSKVIYGKNVKEGLKPEHNLRPGWMLKKDPELAQKIEAKKKAYKVLAKYAGKKIEKKD